MAISKAALAQKADEAAQMIFDAPDGKIHARALQAQLGIGSGPEGKGEDRSSAGDALYRAMKADARFMRRAKDQGRRADWALKPHARRKIKAQREAA